MDKPMHPDMKQMLEKFFDKHFEETKREWQGLTDAEIAGFAKTMERGNFLVAIYDIEKKLKEKNT